MIQWRVGYRSDCCISTVWESVCVVPASYSHNAASQHRTVTPSKHNHIINHHHRQSCTFFVLFSFWDGMVMIGGVKREVGWRYVTRFVCLGASVYVIWAIRTIRCIWTFQIEAFVVTKTYPRNRWMLNIKILLITFWFWAIYSAVCWPCKVILFTNAM